MDPAARAHLRGFGVVLVVAVILHYGLLPILGRRVGVRETPIYFLAPWPALRTKPTESCSGETGSTSVSRRPSRFGSVTRCLCRSVRSRSTCS